MSKIDCNCSDYNERESTRHYENGRLVEIVYRCINCDEITSVWSYGHWLEEIKKHRNEADNSTDEYEFEKINFYNLHVDWLIQQAERVQELENKCEYLSDTNEMLLDLNGVLPDQPELYIKLKKEIKRLEDFIETIQNVHFVELQREKAENRRYRETLELLVKQETLGKDAKTGKTAVSHTGMIALKGLGIFNDDEHIVYGVDEIIESVLEESE